MVLRLIWNQRKLGRWLSLLSFGGVLTALEFCYAAPGGAYLPSAFTSITQPLTQWVSYRPAMASSPLTQGDPLCRLASPQPSPTAIADRQDSRILIADASGGAGLGAVLSMFGWVKQWTHWTTAWSKQSFLDREVALHKVSTEHQPTYQIWVHERMVAAFQGETQARVFQERLRSFLRQPNFQGDRLIPTLHNNQAAIRSGDQLLYVFPKTGTVSDAPNLDLAAIAWTNNLRLALGVSALDLPTAQRYLYGVTSTGEKFEGLASWYGPYFHGRLTANGETYDQYGLTAAHPSLPLGTFLRITNLDNQRSVIIRVNDRGPYIPPRTLDLSLGAAHCLGSVDSGVIPYRAEVLEPGDLPAGMAL